MSDGSNDFIIHRATVADFVYDLNSLDKEEFRKNVTENLLKVVSFSNLHQYQTQTDYTNAVNKLMLAERKDDKLARLFQTCATFSVLPIPVRKTVIQTLLQIFFGHLMAMFKIGVKKAVEKLEELKKKEELQKKEVQNESDENVRVFPVERRSNDDVLRYVGGFVVRSLLKKKCPQETIVKLTKAHNQTHDTDETESWITKLSRGGLINISDEFFELLVQIKNISDKHYCIDYELLRNIKLKENTTKEVLENPQISMKWANLHTGEHSDKWLKHLLDTFLNTRGNCVTKDIKESFQHITQSSIRAKKALRKILKEKAEQGKLEPKTTSVKTPKKKKSSESNGNENKSPIKLQGDMLGKAPATKSSLLILSPPKKVIRVNNKKNATKSSPNVNWDKFVQPELKSSELKTNFQGGSMPIFVPSSLVRLSQTRKTFNTLENTADLVVKENVDFSFLEDDPDADIFLQYL